MADLFPRTSAPASRPPDRWLIAVGTISRHGGRTTTVRATEAGVTGSIRPTGGAR
ncbi:hypothetical protein JHN55_03810 [Streptomyces sp. MBT56]|uniref:hypothetical protein n=1 Tax=unclassified Streptomyces TaxID=2593676 RepID=UPI00190B5D25|nr:MULTISPECIES: hypothetical protein [unclassified Streptomyces]MBK3555685.1 hypothetical protein [Streptomyces sp. MBT56]MBK3602398.1 hypothetical protein [Streptomyces sp. MBT54]MBK3617297.1 hypothetical protein [Streptomyces sp. MBT98]